METHTRVVVIGGGVVGCSILFHLAKFGWRDVILLERSELTSGSSWHAAGQFHTISSDPNISRLQGYTIDLYRELEETSGQSVGLHTPGQVYLASTPERLDYLKKERSKARYMGLELEFITMDEVVEMNPLIDKSKYLGALFDSVDGHIDPSGVTWAYAKSAKHYGAKYYRNTAVIETKQCPDGTWNVVTPNGTINAEHIVNAAGLWAREVGHLAGIELPIQPMEHHYLITEDIPEITAHGREVIAGVDYEANIYFRQEQNGLLLGTYEAKATPWMINGTPPDFGHELLQDDLDRVADRLELAFDRIPALASAGIKSVVNGPFTFGPDGNPMIGPVPGLKNYWAAVAVMAGFCQAGGVGLSLAQWMIEGEPSMDVGAMDIARFGKFATREYGTIKSAENYERRFLLAYPNEELPAMRRQKTTSIHDRLLDRGAVMGVSFGLEHALWFAPDKASAYEQPSYRRSNAFEHVAAEVKAVRNHVGAIEIANFGKHEFKGPGTSQFLDHIMANTLPDVGRLKLSPMLTPKGKLYGDFTLARIATDHFYVLGSGTAQEMHRRWFEQHLVEHAVTYRNCSDELHGIAIAGPNARQLLARMSRDDVSNQSLSFCSVRQTSVAGVPVLLARVSFSGELGYELYCAPQYQLKLFETIEHEGRGLGLRLFGSRALMSLRLEKNWGAWGLDFGHDYSPVQAGLTPFVEFNKEFIGKAAVLEEQHTGPKSRLVSLVVDNTEVDCVYDEAVFHGGECIGYVTSGGYAHHLKKSMAMAYISTEFATQGTSLNVEIIGQRYPATVHTKALYDPVGERLRS